MTLKKNHISPIFKKLKIDWNGSPPNHDSQELSSMDKSFSFSVVSGEFDQNMGLKSDPVDIQGLNMQSLSKTGSAQSSQNLESTEDVQKLSFKPVEQSDVEKKFGENLTGYSRVQELKMVKIGIASSEQMMSWAEKLLPNGKVFGEVLNPNTLHYKTFKPQKGGLFCQRIFGPLKDFECACGIVRKPSSEEGLVQSLIQDRKSKRTYCSVCDVEYTWSVIRRYQLGYIRLASPVTHLWYLKANPSYLSMLLDLRKKDLEDIIYCTQTLTLEDYWRPLRGAPMSLNPNLFFESYKKYLTTSNQDTGLEQSWDRFNLNEQKPGSSGLQLGLRRGRSATTMNEWRRQTREKQKRKKVKPPRRSLSYFPFQSQNWNDQGDEPLIPSLAFRSKKDQIESLETAYRLSTDDYETRKFSRLTHLAPIFIQKKIRGTKKDLFLEARDSTLKAVYTRCFNTFLKKSFLSREHFIKDPLLCTNALKQSISIRTQSSPLNTEKEPNNHNGLDSFLTPPFKKVLKHHLKMSVQVQNKKRLHTLPNLLGLRWGAGSYYRDLSSSSKKLKNESFNPSNHAERSLNVPVDSMVSFEAVSPLSQGVDSQSRFLTVFLNFIRKAKVNESWPSIYEHSFESTFGFSSLIGIGNSSAPLISLPLSLHLNSMEEFFSNSAILYLLFVLQNSNAQVIVSQFLLTQKHIWVPLVLINSIDFTMDQEQEQFGSLKDLLNQELITENTNKSNFLEINSVVQNFNLRKFISFNLQVLLKMYLCQQLLQKASFYKKKTFNIFVLDLRHSKQVHPIQTQFALNLKNSTSIFLESQQVHPQDSNRHFEKNVNQMLRQRKILSFLLQNSNFPQDALSYLKNRLQLQKNLSDFQSQKLSPAFQLFNNIYTTSYVETWQTEKDWKYFSYYNKALIDDSDQLLPIYRFRFPMPAHEATMRSSTSLSNKVLSSWTGKYVPILGANILQNLLFQYEGTELKKMAKQHQNVVPRFNRYIRWRKQRAVKKSDYADVRKLLQIRDDLIRRLKLLRKLFKKNTKTSSMILNTIPVLPPDLRPILKMQNQIAASDLNRFYQRILYRNDRLRKFIRSNAAMMNSEPAFEVKYAQRLLQEAVDNLIQNGKGQVKPETNSRGQPLKSLSEILKGKQGRFRQYLLGKRVDYSGRSVIVVGPTLKIYECGLPFEMAMELFLPFLIKRIFQYDLARTVMGAKTILKNDPKTTWHLLEEIMQHHPILLNRAPTLHRLGIQAFRPKLITGRAILLHPLVCPAFNADFDGDQMAVHLPITVEARTEAWKLMFSRNHLISPATGEPILLPTQDMVLGCYYLTTTSAQDQKQNVNYPFSSVTQFYFSNMKDILQAYLQEKIHLQTPIWMRWNGLLEADSHSSFPYEIRILPDGSWLEIQPEYHRQWRPTGQWNQLFVKTTPGRILFNLLVQNCIDHKV